MSEDHNSRFGLLAGAVIVIVALMVISIAYLSQTGTFSPKLPSNTPNPSNVSTPSNISSGNPCIGINGLPCGYQSNSTTNSTTPTNSTFGNSTTIINVTEELNNSAQQGFNLTESMFYANSSQDCSKQLISACDNNVPSQFICINAQYASNVTSQYSQVHSTGQACPMFLLEGSISCGLIDNYCVIVDQKTT